MNQNILETQYQSWYKMLTSFTDNEIFRLGIQMLFEDYLDQYNELCENPKWESLVSDTVRCYKYYVCLNG